VVKLERQLFPNNIAPVLASMKALPGTIKSNATEQEQSNEQYVERRLRNITLPFRKQSSGSVGVSRRGKSGRRLPGVTGEVSKHGVSEREACVEGELVNGKGFFNFHLVRD
jgi:hypothetical protein